MQFQQQMILFGGKIKTIKNYDYDLNYILFQYRSQIKRKTIKPFLPLMRGIKHDQDEDYQEVDENKDLFTPLQLVGKYLQTAQKADRFYNQKQSEVTDSTNFDKSMYQQNEANFCEELSELAKRFELFQVQQQEFFSNAVSQQKQCSQKAQNNSKLLFQLTENESVLQSKCKQKQQIQDFKHFIRRGINDQNFKLKLDYHSRNSSEQKEMNQLISNYSDLRSDSSKQNTTQSERKLQNNESSPQTKQIEEDNERINVKQISFQKNKKLENECLFDEGLYNSKIYLQKYSNSQTKHKQQNKSQFEGYIHQKVVQDKYLKPIRQSIFQVNQIQLKQKSYKSETSMNQMRLKKNVQERKNFFNQIQIVEDNQFQSYNQQNCQTSRSSDQAALEKFAQHKFYMNNLGIPESESYKQSSHKFQLNQDNQNKDIVDVNNLFTTNQYIRKIKNIQSKNELTSQMNFIDKNHNQIFRGYINNQISNANQYQKDIKLDQSKKFKYPQSNKQQYGNKYKGSQTLNRASYAKKQKQKDEKQKKQLKKSRSKISTPKKYRNNNQKRDKIIAQEEIQQIIQVKDHTKDQENTFNQINIQKQKAIRTEPLKRQSKDQILVKSASHIQNCPSSNRQHTNSQAKQSSHIKVKSISGTKSQEQENLLKMIGGSQHLKDFSSLVIQPKQLCFQMQKQQLAQFMAVNSISIKYQPSCDESEDASINSKTFRFTLNNLTTFNLQDALQEDSKGLHLNEQSKKQKQEINNYQLTQQYATEDFNLDLKEEGQTYQPLFVSYKKFNDKSDQQEMVVIEQLQSNKIMSSSQSHDQVYSRTYQDYKNHFNPKKALSRMKQYRETSQLKKENLYRHQKDYHSLSPSKRIEGAIQGIKKRWEKNAQRFRTKLYNC